MWKWFLQKSEKLRVLRRTKNKISISNTSGNLQPSFDYNFPILELY